MWTRNHSVLSASHLFIRNWYETYTVHSLLPFVLIVTPSGGSNGRGGTGGHAPQSDVCPPLDPQMKFLVSAFGQKGWKINDCMLVLCQKLHICTYNRPNFSGAAGRRIQAGDSVTNETLWQFAPFSDISQGSVATHLRPGEIFRDGITNFLLILMVKQFRKSVDIW